MLKYILPILLTGCYVNNQNDMSGTVTIEHRFPICEQLEEVNAQLQCIELCNNINLNINVDDNVRELAKLLDKDQPEELQGLIGVE